jgi:hypothetical protein
MLTGVEPFAMASGPLLEFEGTVPMPVMLPLASLRLDSTRFALPAT